MNSMISLKYIIGLLNLVIYTSCVNDHLDELNLIENCATASPSYQNHIKPILDINCNIRNCHQQGSIETFSLATYPNVLEQIPSEKFLKSINHQSGAIAMPKSASKLTACQITTITKWIQNGTPYN